jgi:hypothetical protein
MNEIFAALLGGLLVVGANIATVAYFLGGMKERVHSHGERLNKLEKNVELVRLDVATMKGESL